MDFASSSRATENRRTRGKGFVAKLSVVPQTPGKVIGENRSSKCSVHVLSHKRAIVNTTANARELKFANSKKLT